MGMDPEDEWRRRLHRRVALGVVAELLVALAIALVVGLLLNSARWGYAAALIFCLAFVIFWIVVAGVKGGRSKLGRLLRAAVYGWPRSN